MSVQKRAGKKRPYRVRWYEDGNRERSKSFKAKRDADLFNAEVTRRKALGSLHVLQESRTLESFVEDRWAPDRASSLATATRESYGWLWSSHIAPTFAKTRLRNITSPKVADWRSKRQAEGVGLKGLKEAQSLLGTILQYAVELGEIEYNAARNVRPIRVPKPEPVRPLPPSEVEAIRAAFYEPIKVAASDNGKRRRKAFEIPRDPVKAMENATLVSVLAYGGLRPAEALGCRWADLSGGTLLVARALDLAGRGVVKSTKTGRSRTVKLLAPLAQDLAEWKIACGSPDPTEPIFPRPDGTPWNKSDWQNWRVRHWKPALAEAGLPAARPYDLRHSFASLLMAEGRSPIYAANQCGHSASMLTDTYAKVIGEFEDRVKIDPEAEIRSARNQRKKAMAPRS